MLSDTLVCRFEGAVVGNGLVAGGRCVGIAFAGFLSGVYDAIEGLGFADVVGGWGGSAGTNFGFGGEFAAGAWNFDWSGSGAGVGQVGGGALRLGLEEEADMVERVRRGFVESELVVDWRWWCRGNSALWGSRSIGDGTRYHVREFDCIH